MYDYQRVSVSGGEPDPPAENKPEGPEGSLQQPQKIRLITCCVVLALLIAAHVALISLWASHALDKHLFSIAKLSAATQAITLVAQAWITILLTLLGVVVQGIAADQIIRRCEGRSASSIGLIAEDHYFDFQVKRLPRCKTAWTRGMGLVRR
jgi:hypothetical protein